MLAEQFADADQQSEAAHLGMWTFLATEVLFFGGLFMAYILYRHLYPEAFALGSRQTNLLFGTLNTGILLTSSLTMTQAVHAAQESKTGSIANYLLVTILFAVGFLVVKGFEYHEDFVEKLVPGSNFNTALPPRAGLFFLLYWAMTGLHASGHWPALRDYGAGSARAVFEPLLHAGRSFGIILALCGPGVDLPFPTALPDPLI